MKVYIPLRGFDYPDGIITCDQEFERLETEISSLNSNPQLIELLDGNEEDIFALKKITFSIIENDNNKELKELSEAHPSFHVLYIWYVLVIEIQYIVEREYAEDSSFYPDTYLKRLSVLLNITYATPIEFLPGIVFSGAKFVGTTEYNGGPFNQTYRSMATLAWPKIPKLGLNQVLTWLISNKIKFYGTSDSNASRAVNAYTHLFNYHLWETDSAFLFWCMLGIEALFAKGNTSISEQIRNKINLIFGEPVDFKKKLSKLYEYRSRLIHGDFDFPAKFSIEHKKFAPEYWDYVGFGSSILLSSIKLLISEDLPKFEFALTWIDKQNEDKI